MTLLLKLFSFLRKVYRLPLVKQAARSIAKSVIKEAVADSKTKVDDKLVAVVEAAMANKNYRAVLNGKAKK